jgi:hypothetical protein
VLFGAADQLSQIADSPLILVLEAVAATMTGFRELCCAATGLSWHLRKSVYERYVREVDYKKRQALFDPLLDLLASRVERVNSSGIIQWFLPLYTTNYETNLFDSCASKTYPWPTPIDGFGTDFRWSRRLVECNLLTRGHRSLEKPLPLVVHLHGCVRWVRYGYSELRREGKPAFEDLDSGRTNEVIFPHEKAFRLLEPYATHHSLLATHLKEVRSAVVIGFEFRRSDPLIVQAFREAMTQPGFSLIIANPRVTEPAFADQQLAELCSGGGVHQRVYEERSGRIHLIGTPFGLDGACVKDIERTLPSI